jgi:hypothetical protein
MSKQLEARREWVISRIEHWRDRLLLDVKTRILVEFPESWVEGHRERVPPESIRKEELLVSQLERILLGEKQFALASAAASTLPNSGPLATVDESQAEYNRFTVTFYPELMNARNEAFKTVAESCVVHEMVHVMLWPMTSYLFWLESERLDG